METIDNFMDRIFVVFPTDKVYVWKSKMEKELDKDCTDVWSLQTTKNYVDWLKGKNIEVSGVKKGLDLW